MYQGWRHRWIDTRQGIRCIDPLHTGHPIWGSRWSGFRMIGSNHCRCHRCKAIHQSTSVVCQTRIPPRCCTSHRLMKKGKSMVALMGMRISNWILPACKRKWQTKQAKRTIAPNPIIAVKIDSTRNRLFRPGIYGRDNLPLPKARIPPRYDEAVVPSSFNHQRLRETNKRPWTNKKFMGEINVTQTLVKNVISANGHIT